MISFNEMLDALTDGSYTVVFRDGEIYIEPVKSKG